MRMAEKVDEKVINLLDTSAEDLAGISKSLGLELSQDEMTRIQKYFRRAGRNPTRTEVEALAQAWSEHCCYKSSKFWIKRFIYPVAEEKVVTKEDAGAIDFDSHHYLVAALESHNHPSAISPYGGAGTGIGGILRDVLCMGAQPIALVDPLFFGDPDTDYDSLPPGVKHPRYIFKGVFEGIRDYGNRVGIPTVAGMISFHKSYLENPLVNVGCVGIVEKGRLVPSSSASSDGILLLAGGKTGRDGIHGVTFASAELCSSSEDSSSRCVQIGDPITKEPLMHAFLDCVNQGLFLSSKDLGGGGLSCASSELANAGGRGAVINLDKVLLKEKDMESWEIWVSESQERMLLEVSPKNLDKVFEIFEHWGVSISAVGKLIPERVIRVFRNEQKILELDSGFFVDAKEIRRKYIFPKVEREDNNSFEMPSKEKLEEISLSLLNSINASSRERVIRQYDHEVRGATLLKPLQGKIGTETHGDASVIKPLLETNRGIALTTDVNPEFLGLDPWRGTMSAVDEACRNLISVGSKPVALLDCLNFGDPEKPEIMGQFVQTNKALKKIASTLGLPLMSGNVSLYNEGVSGAIVPTPLIMGIGLIEDTLKCVSSDLKGDGNPVYLVGDTRKELGGSLYYRQLGLEGGIVPKCNPEKLKKSAETLLTICRENLALAIHDPSEGGIWVALAEMAIGGDTGFEANLSTIEKIRNDFRLFSETNTRWLVEVKSDVSLEFEKIFSRQGVHARRLGKVGGSKLKINCAKRNLVDLDLDKAREAWKKGLDKVMD
jgi:phosphoribosylformylglycinamidine synthase